MTDTFEAPEFALHADRAGPVATVAVVGELDVATAPDLIAAIGALEPGYEELVIDLSACSFFASSGISVLLDENARATAEEFRLRGRQGAARGPAHLRPHEPRRHDHVPGRLIANQTFVLPGWMPQRVVSASTIASPLPRMWTPSRAQAR